MVAGQSVPHIHVHILPRQGADFEGVNDRVYPALEKAEQRLAKDMLRETRGESPRTARWDTPADEDRRPRSEEEMEKEALWLSRSFDDWEERLGNTG